MEIFEQFGINGWLLAAQVVNFLILLFILKKFFYKPLLKVLDERKQKIAQSMKNAEEIEKTLAKTEEDREKKLEKAADEAKKIIGDAQKSAVDIIEEARSKASDDIAEMVKKGQASLESEKERLHQEIRAELAEIVGIALEKVTDKALTSKEQKALIEKSVKEIK